MWKRAPDAVAARLLLVLVLALTAALIPETDVDYLDAVPVVERA
jgi:hypothetical protein